MCAEDLPRLERATETYSKQSRILEKKILSVWSEWDESRKRLHIMYNQAVADHPQLIDFVQNLQTQAKLRFAEARGNLRYKLLQIEHQESKSFTDYVSDMASMLKKLYLTLKGYDRATPDLTNEYFEIMKKAKSVKSIIWSDEEPDDDLLKFVSSLDLEKPISGISFDDNEDTVSDDLSNIENQEPIRLSGKKRKGTPVVKGTSIKLINNETIIINDSFENLDVTRHLNSAKKFKKELSSSLHENNYGTIDPNCLNSTFVMANKMECKQNIKAESKDIQPVKHQLSDSNTMTRTNIFKDRGK